VLICTCLENFYHWIYFITPQPEIINTSPSKPITNRQIAVRDPCPIFDSSISLESTFIVKDSFLYLKLKEKKQKYLDHEENFKEKISLEMYVRSSDLKIQI
jgi:hypothetical protein